MGDAVRYHREHAIRILLVSSGSGSRGGGEIFLDYLGQGLANRGHQVLAWIPAHPRMDELAARCGRFARVVRSAYRNTYDRTARSLATCFNWSESRRIAREWEALEPDVVHLNKQNLEDGLDLLRAARQCAVPSICTIHITQTARYLRARAAPVRDAIARAALRRYRGALVAVQEARRAELDGLVGGRVPTHTVFNGVPLAASASWRDARAAKRAELGLENGDFLILGLGRLVEQKRPFLFLETARELHRHLPAARFLWVGDGNFAARWQQWISRQHLAHVIACAGWQTDTLPFLLAADLLLHVAEYEGLPLAIVEAMATGLPCAVPQDFASETGLFDERNVLYCDDVPALAAKLHDRAQLKAVAAGASHLVEHQLSYRAMLDSYERLYREAVGR